LADTVAMDSLETPHEHHAVDAQLLTVNCSLDSFDNLFVLPITSQLSMQLALQGLPTLRIAILNHSRNVFDVEVSNHRLEYMRLTDGLLLIVVFL
jgi:hypothetical protein